MATSVKKAFVFSVKHTYPMLISWVPVALAYGLMMRNAGFNFLWTLLSGVAIPFGSLGMVAVSFYQNAVPLATVGLTAAAMACRHLFYGISFLERFKRFGASRFYMIYMLCDELYSLFCAYEIPADADEKWVHLFTALLLQGYWLFLIVSSSVLGALIPFDLTGIDFALTALFATILLDMIRSDTTALPAAVGGAASVLSLAVFGADNFLLPALVLTVFALALLRGNLEGKRTEALTNGN